MAKAEFLRSVRVAGSLLTHRMNADDPRLDPEKVEGQLARAAIWLTPSAVKGFDVRDFGELPADRRQELRESVERFLQVARQVPREGIATPEQVRDGMAAFREVLEILRPYRPDGSETRRIREVLEEVHFPDFVVNWIFDVGEDWSGDPSVWIYVFIKEQAAEAPGLIDETTRINERIRLALADADILRLPYLSFRTASEQRSLESIAT